MPNNRPPYGSPLPDQVGSITFRDQTTDNRFLVETHEMEGAASFGPNSAYKWDSIADYGILHPTKPGYRLVRIVRNDQTGKHNWIWAQENEHDDERNFITSYSGQSNAHPIYVREYVVLRETYIPANAKTKGQPLRKVIGLIRTNDGTTKLANGVYDLEFTGGGGTGVTGRFSVLNGKVNGQWLTNCGDDYTSAPTVTLSGVDEAVVTAVVQPATALLTEEDQIQIQGEMATIFIGVRRKYETLPGPEITQERYNSRGDLETVTTQRQTAGTGADPDGLLVTGSGTQAESTVVETKETSSVEEHATLTGKEFNRERAHGQEVEVVETIVAPSTVLTDPTYASGVLDHQIVQTTRTKATSRKISLKAGKFQPMLAETHIDQQTGICVDIFKTFVPAGTKGGIGNVISLAVNSGGTSALSDGWYDITWTGSNISSAIGKVRTASGVAVEALLLFGGSGYASAPTAALAGSTATFTVARAKGYCEVQPFDKWLSLALTSVLRDGANGTGSTTIPVDSRYGITLRESFPNILRDVVLVETSSTLSQQSYNLIEGYAGPVDGRITQKYMTDAEYRNWPSVAVGTIFTTQPEVTRWNPQANRVAIEVAGGTAYTKDFPLSLHEEFAFSIFGGSVTGTLPATLPTDLPYETWVVRSIKPEQWRFDMWLVQIEEILVPPDFQNG